MRAAVMDDWTSPARSHARGHRHLAFLISVTVVLAAGSVLVAGSVIAARSLRLSPVLSGSMRPGIQPGDLAITEPVPVASLSSGDVISFYPPTRTDAVLHRLITVTALDDGTWITTKGDANDTTDPWGEVRLRGDTAWRLVGSVPVIGFFPMWTQGLRGPVLLLAGLLMALSGFRAVRGSSSPAMHPTAAFRYARSGTRVDTWRDMPQAPGRRLAG